MVLACSSNTISYHARLVPDDDGEPSLLVNMLLPTLLLIYTLMSKATDFLIGHSFRSSLREYRIRFDYCMHIVAPHFQVVQLLCRSCACFLGRRLGRDLHDQWTTSWKLPVPAARERFSAICHHTRVAGPDVRYRADVEAMCGLRSMI